MTELLISNFISARLEIEEYFLAILVVFLPTPCLDLRHNFYFLSCPCIFIQKLYVSLFFIHIDVSSAIIESIKRKSRRLDLN